MQRPILLPPGSPLEALDTPALVVDIAALRTNVGRIHRHFASRSIVAVPDVTAHGCPPLAREQLRVRSRGGISVDTVTQAELFGQYSFKRISINNHVTSLLAMSRLCHLARRTRVRILVDDLTNAKNLSEAALQHGVTISALVEMRVGPAWCGVPQGSKATELCRRIESLPGLDFAGIGATITDDSRDGGQLSRVEVQLLVQQLATTRLAVQRAGIRVATVSLGGAGLSWSNIESGSGITEAILGGQYLGDVRSRRDLDWLTPAARVLSTVTSRPEPGCAIADAGNKSLSSDGGMPVVDAMPDLKSIRLNAEHCLLTFEADRPHEGEKLWLIPSDVGATANLHDYIWVGESGRLAAVWQVAARGRY